jgi:hypothetical protein
VGPKYIQQNHLKILNQKVFNEEGKVEEVLMKWANTELCCDAKTIVRWTFLLLTIEQLVFKFLFIIEGASEKIYKLFTPVL